MLGQGAKFITIRRSLSSKPPEKRNGLPTAQRYFTGTVRVLAGWT
jgi:hypothetical protein